MPHDQLPRRLFQVRFPCFIMPVSIDKHEPLCLRMAWRDGFYQQSRVADMDNERCVQSESGIEHRHRLHWNNPIYLDAERDHDGTGDKQTGYLHWGRFEWNIYEKCKNRSIS